MADVLDRMGTALGIAMLAFGLVLVVASQVGAAVAAVKAGERGQALARVGLVCMILAGTVLVLVKVASGTLAEPQSAVDVWREAGYPACVEEDAPNAPCFWDASQRGNGSGLSFLVTDDGEQFNEDGSTQ